MKADYLCEEVNSLDGIPFIDWDRLKNCTILLTGATGLIGSETVFLLNYMNKKKELMLKIIALVRDAEKAKEKFQSIIGDGMLFFIQGSVEKCPEIPGHVDYIIHGASKTSSLEMVNNPVETIQTTVIGTNRLLEIAVKKRVKGFVYLSSMEIYGYPGKGHHIIESDIGSFSPFSVRNSYPISKLMCENLCVSYTKEYGVQAKIVRLAQTIANDADDKDTRFCAYLSRCLKEHKNIVLKTFGESERCYLYVGDAVTAILVVLLNGISGEAYNVADENTYCSIKELAENAAAYGRVKVEYDIQSPSVNGYRDTTYMYLDTGKIKNLGWEPVLGRRCVSIYSIRKKQLDDV